MMTRKKVVILFIALVAVCASVVMYRSDLMTPSSLSYVDEKYLMYVLMQDESTTEAINKRVQFDASHLLKQPRYIKANDIRLIDLEHEPIKELDWKLAFRIQQYIPDSSEFTSIKKLPHKNIDETMKDKTRWEYLYSGFSLGNTKKPDYDYFKFYLMIDDQEYQN